MTTRQRPAAPQPTLTPEQADALSTLVEGGWEPVYSQYAQMWMLRHVANRWSTSLHADMDKAIEAAAKIAKGAQLWGENKERLRAQIRGA